MKGNLYTLLYAAVMGIVCALLLTGVGWFTAPYRAANAQAEEVRNILSVLGISFENNTSADELLQIFEKQVRLEESGDLTLYKYVGADEEVLAVAVFFAGQGLWGPIKGFLALEPDMKTIRGVTFHEQEETPGLGGEITAGWFRDQFKGKSIYDREGNPVIVIRIGSSSEDMGDNEVDGITGATLTCNKVEAMLNAVIAKIAQQSGENNG